MPNHVTNILTIKGNMEEVTSVFNKIKIDKEEVGTIDFNKIIPMPESLNLTSGSITEETMFWALSKMPDKECAKYFNLLRSSKDILNENRLDTLKNRFSIKDISRVAKNAADYTPDENERKLGISDYESLGKMYLKNLEEYGAPDWYDWRINNWGTKWNAYETKLLNDNSIGFQTAWSTPLDIIKALSLQYPSLQFEVKYADEDYGYNVGEYTYKNGEMTKEYIPKAGSEQATKMAEEIVMDYLKNECNLLDEPGTANCNLLDEPDKEEY